MTFQRTNPPSKHFAEQRAQDGCAAIVSSLGKRGAHRGRVASPPTGTVTFLFTDIEGSTRMWERSPQAMQAALARHDEILKRHRGAWWLRLQDCR